MKWLHILVLVIPVICVTHSFGQSQQCPSGLVCISPAAARQALEDSDVRKALEQQVLDLKKAILDEKSVTLDVKIELARTSGQLTGVQGENVTLRALVDMLSKQVRPKKIGFINLF